MNDSSLSSLRADFKSLSAFITPYDVTVTPSLKSFPANLSNEYFNQPEAWYRYARANYYAQGHHLFNNAFALANAYYQQDTQFPPDLRRLVLLSTSIHHFQPDLILEWGCGSSTSIIHDYVHQNTNSFAFTVDSSSEWLNVTSQKLGNQIDNHLLTPYNSLITSNHDFQSYRRIFVYLDAPMCINKLSSQSHSDIEVKDIFGLKSLSSFLSSKLSHVDDILILIDSRSVAVENLYILSDALSRNLHYYGNTVSSYSADLVNRVVQGDLNYINKHPFLLSLSKSPLGLKNIHFQFMCIAQCLAMSSASLVYFDHDK